MTAPGYPLFIEVDGASLWTVAFGPAGGLPIVFVGGWAGSSELWLGPISWLSAGYRCVAFDHRGTGATIADPESITHRRLVDDVFAVMDRHEVGRAVLAAESAGAGVVLAAAVRAPERVAGIVLVDPLIPRVPPTDDEPFVRGLRADFAATIAAFVDACAPDPAHEKIRAWGRAILARSTPEQAIALLRADVPDPSLALSAVHAPTLIIHCDGDAIAPVDGARELAAALPGAALQVLSGHEHTPTLTRPREIALLMEGWLRAVR